MTAQDWITSAIARNTAGQTGGDDWIAEAIERNRPDLGGMRRSIGTGLANMGAAMVEGGTIAASNLVPPAFDAVTSYADLVTPGAATRMGTVGESVAGIIQPQARGPGMPATIGGDPSVTPYEGPMDIVNPAVPPEVQQAFDDRDLAGRQMQSALLEAGFAAGHGIRKLGPEYERSGGVRGLAEDVVGAVPQLGAGILAGAGGTLLGGPPVGIAAAAGTFAATDGTAQTAETYQRLIADGLSPQEAAARATRAGALYSAASGLLEFAGVGAVLRGTKLLRGLGAASERVARSTGRAGRAGRAAGRTVGAGVGEGTTEVAQGIIGEATTAWVRDEGGWAEFQREWNNLDVRGREFLVGAILGVTVRGGTELIDPANYRSFEEMVEAIETELLEASPSQQDDTATLEQQARPRPPGSSPDQGSPASATGSAGSASSPQSTPSASS